MAPIIKVEVQYPAGRDGDVPSQRAVARWARAALADHGEGAQLVVRIVDEAEGRGLNRRYRGGKGATNVLSFPYDGPPVVRPALLGDIVLCRPVVEREADAQGKPRAAHWAHLVVHGVLHLLGYDHERHRDAVIMEALETRILATLGLPDPYRESLPVPASRRSAAGRRSAGR
jgi:probable rRNA maturation factor